VDFLNAKSSRRNSHRGERGCPGIASQRHRKTDRCDSEARVVNKNWANHSIMRCIAVSGFDSVQLSRLSMVVEVFQKLVSWPTLQRHEAIGS